MKTVRTLSIFVLASVITSIFVHAQESDSKRIHSFKASVQTIDSAVFSATEAHQLDSLKQRIQSLDDAYHTDQELVNIALHPDSYQSELSRLNQIVRIRYGELSLIESQSDQLSHLSTKLMAYEKELSRLTDATDSLASVIAESRGNEGKLNQTISKYRSQLEARDEIIALVLDSLLLPQYDTMNGELASTTEGSQRVSRFDVVSWISDISQQQLSTLKNQNNQLLLQDYIRSYALYLRISESWDVLEHKLLEDRSKPEAKKHQEHIVDQLTEWKRVVVKRAWDEMDAYWKTRGVELAAFDNNDSFFSALDTFLEQAKSDPSNHVFGSKNRADFEAFSYAWHSMITSNLGEDVQKSGMLQLAQVAHIDEQLSEWKETSTPLAAWVWGLMGTSLAALGMFALVMIKTRKTGLR